MIEHTRSRSAWWMSRQSQIIIGFTALILLVPLVAMQFTDEVNWDLTDFLVAGILLGGMGFLYVFASKKTEHIASRSALALALFAALLLIWMNLAVGIIDAPDNPANMLYLGILAVGIIGAIRTRLQPRGMSQTLLAMAITQAAVTAIALLVGLEGSLGFVILNGFFFALWLGSAWLFRRAAQK